ncbi:hypothetical protein HZC53_03395 [Candidatus Uhrbacteria bacterium]|nr:hypothetical protein [Candidatus Uhrbacteria bacterium]
MKIKIVDGWKIRNTVETDFSGWGTHADYPLIPLGEIWLDRYLKPERKLILDLIRLERSMRGKSFRLIRAEAKKTLTAPNKSKPRVIKTQKFGKTKIVYVDGADVRSQIDPYFLLGGHDLVYDYIPKNEIWIDTRCYEQEWVYTLIHENHERELMARGMAYDNAHDFALAAERMARRKDKVADFVRG